LKYFLNHNYFLSHCFLELILPDVRTVLDEVYFLIMFTARRLRIGDFIKDNWENTHSAAADECGKHKIAFISIIKLGNIGLPKTFLSY
jgi:hypothetical protein